MLEFDSLANHALCHTCCCQTYACNSSLATVHQAAYALYLVCIMGLMGKLYQQQDFHNRQIFSLYNIVKEICYLSAADELNPEAECELEELLEADKLNPEEGTAPQGCTQLFGLSS